MPRAPATSAAGRESWNASPTFSPCEEAAMDVRVPVGTRAGRLHHALAAHVTSGDMPGIVALVSRRGETRVEVIGAQSFGGTPMRRDTIFRIASMTKPITAAAALILVEECRLRLDDPVDSFLPELADRKVL